MNGRNDCRWRAAARAARAQGGFTLLELLVVIVIIGVLATLVAPRFVGRTKEARIAAAKAQIEMHFGPALDMYELDNGQYPTTDQGLDALRVEPAKPPVPTNWKEPYLKKDVPLDPWGNEYVYRSPGAHNPEGYDLESYGPDGRDGGGDDIENW